MAFTLVYQTKNIDINSFCYAPCLLLLLSKEYIFFRIHKVYYDDGYLDFVWTLANIRFKKSFTS